MTTDSGEPSGDEVWQRPAGPGSDDRDSHPRDSHGNPAPSLPPPAPARLPADHTAWRRPAGQKPDGGPDRGDDRPNPPTTYQPPPYPGPPPTQPPPPGWRPPVVVQPAEPRRLPAQDHARIDVEERGARTLTLGVGMIAGAVALIVTCLLCSRVLF